MTGPSHASFREPLLAALPNLRAFAISLCGDADRADDLVQDTVVKAWNSFDSFQEGTNMRAWLFTILRNTFLSERRKRKREVEDVDGALTIGLSVHPEQPGHMDMVDFRRALSRLSDEQREALILVGAEGFSYEEAAQVCDCAVGTIKSRVNRARASLTQALQLRDGTEFGPSATVAAIIGELPR